AASERVSATDSHRCTQIQSPDGSLVLSSVKICVHLWHELFFLRLAQFVPCLGLIDSPSWGRRVPVIMTKIIALTAVGMFAVASAFGGSHVDCTKQASNE